VRETWKPILGDAEFEKKWNRVLHDGLFAGSELPEVVPDVKGEAFAELGRATGAASGLEIVFVPSPSLHDGQFANNGWLQELPDPLTKLTWDNPAVVSPKTAETSGLVNEDVVRVEYAGRSLELPVWIVPGMADGVVALTLGYGRRRVGRYADGRGHAEGDDARAVARPVEHADPDRPGATAPDAALEGRQAADGASGGFHPAGGPTCSDGHAALVSHG